MRKVRARAGTNHLAPMGSLQIVLADIYNHGNSGTGRGINIKIVVQVGDDKGNIINAEGTIRIV
jgi:hypothetical protein